jgi:cytochrome c peroxidase
MKIINPSYKSAISLALNIGYMAALLFLLSACNHSSQHEAAAPQIPNRKMMAELGRKIFFDVSLSASGKQSCATCHDPSHAFAPANDLAVQLGGPQLDKQGARAVPSLRYVLNRTPVWHQPFVASMAERIREGVESPAGGFAWDGRFNTLHEQAEFPLLAQNEMANTSALEISKKISQADYAHEFRNVFGGAVFNSPQLVYKNALMAIEQFELDDPGFHPYSSKYDAYLDGKAKLSPQESRGFALFNDPTKGNCASCHIDTKGADGSHPLFTNYQYEALGVPRNREISANADSNYFDKGVCGPTRKSLTDNTDLCGLFKAPTLRNVATRGAFFHNGYFHTLKAALQFYVQRDTNPERWYPHGKDGAVKFDDLPPAERANINVIDLPLNNKRGGKPIWNERDIEDVIAFLKTLTDQDVKNR